MGWRKLLFHATHGEMRRVLHLLPFQQAGKLPPGYRFHLYSSLSNAGWVLLSVVSSAPPSFADFRFEHGVGDRDSEAGWCPVLLWNGGVVARREGFEPTTPRFVVWCSIQLSYRRDAPRNYQWAQNDGRGRSPTVKARPFRRSCQEAQARVERSSKLDPEPENWHRHAEPDRCGGTARPCSTTRQGERGRRCATRTAHHASSSNPVSARRGAVVGQQNARPSPERADG